MRIIFRVVLNILIPTVSITLLVLDVHGLISELKVFVDLMVALYSLDFSISNHETLLLDGKKNFYLCQFI